MIKEIHNFSFKNMHMKMSSAKWQPFCLSLNVLTKLSVMEITGPTSGWLMLTHWGRDKWTPFRQRHFQMNFLDWKCLISIKISLKFVPKGPINKIPALVQITAWRRPGDKLLSEPMMVSLPTHICVSRPQWVKTHYQLHLSLAEFGMIGRLHQHQQGPNHCQLNCLFKSFFRLTTKKT